MNIRVSLPTIVVVCLATIVTVTAFGDLLDSLLSDKPGERESACAEFERLDWKEKAALIPPLLKAAKSADAPQPIKTTLLNTASELLLSRNSDMRFLAGRILTALEPEEAIAILNKVATDTGQPEDVRWFALAQLSEKKRVPLELLPFIIAGLDTPAPPGSAFAAVKALGPQAESAVPALVQILKRYQQAPDKSNALGNVLYEAMETLGALGVTALSAAPTLVELLHDDSDTYRRTAARTLAKIGPAVEELLIASTASQNFRTREGAADALLDIKPRSESTIATFVRLTQDENECVRDYARAALRDVHTDAARNALAHMAERGNEEGQRTKAESERIHTKEEIVASSGPDANHRYPRELERGFPMTGYNGEEFFVTVYSGEDWPWCIAVWARLDGGYKLLWKDEMNGGPESGHFEEIEQCHVGNGILLHIPWVNAGTGHSRVDTIFALSPGHALLPVSLEDPATWYKDKLKEGEAVWKDAALFLSDNHLGFRFWIWNKDDANCCPSAGVVRGTYRLVGDRLQNEKLRLVVDECVREEVPKP